MSLRIDALAGCRRGSRHVDDLLRGQGVHEAGQGGVPWRALLLTLFVAGGFYGLVLGSFGGPSRQSLYCGLKVPLLLVITSVVSAPTLLAVQTGLGLRVSVRVSLHAALAMQAVAALALASLAPIIALAYLSGLSYPLAIVSNGVAFAAASAIGQLAFLRLDRGTPQLPRQRRRARAAWMLMYVFVGIQAAWMLRPFVGWSGLEPEFLRLSQWTNAYVGVFEALRRSFAG